MDAETDRMARLFLGKEDDEQAKRRLKIVQVHQYQNVLLCQGGAGAGETYDVLACGVADRAPSSRVCFI